MPPVSDIKLTDSPANVQVAVSKISILTAWRVKREIHIFLGMFFVKEKKNILAGIVF